MIINKPKNIERHNLKEITFIIPVRIDSQDRLRNLICVCCYLLSNFDTNLLIKESDSHSKFTKEALPAIENCLGDTSSIKYIFEYSNNPIFHRQKILNDMIMQCNTKIIANYDCDIILPITSYLIAYNLMIANNIDIVYPYGYGNYQKRVFATNDTIVNFFKNNFDFKILESKSKNASAQYGFCQFVNRETYIASGLENENFISYGPEDKERYHRFLTFQYKICRIDNIVYHLEHKRFLNSLPSNPYMVNNNEEWYKIKKMSSNELSQYIKNQQYYLKRTNN